jgi:hypothetical protein
MNITGIEGTDVIPQAEGYDLFIRQLMLPVSRQFESKADWDGPEIVVSQTPDLLLSEEVSYLKQHQALPEDIWDAWEDPGDGLASVTAPMKMSQLQQQMENRLRARKLICGGVFAGSISTVTVIGLSVGTPTDGTHLPSALLKGEDRGRNHPGEQPGPPGGRAGKEDRQRGGV